MPSPDELFHQFLQLTGKPIEVGVASLGKRLKGTVVYAMFDSFLLESNGKRRTIRFDDISYLETA